MKKHVTARKRNKGISLLLFLLFLAGLSLLLYPTFSDWWNSLHQSRAIASYQEAASQLDQAGTAKLCQDAQEYNASLKQDAARFTLNQREKERYESLLCVSGSVMGVVEIPSIHVSLPLYHGTDPEVLQTAVGHLAGSSLPVGGAGTHCVISGLPSARLFTDLDQLKEGDLFTLSVLNQTLWYEVDQIRVVEPNDTSLLALEEGQDLCTLVTCTPYGVNSHRLLVRGHRVPTPQQETGPSTDSVTTSQRGFWVIAVALPALLLLILWAKRIRTRKKNPLGRGSS